MPSERIPKHEVALFVVEVGSESESRYGVWGRNGVRWKERKRRKGVWGQAPEMRVEFNVAWWKCAAGAGVGARTVCVWAAVVCVMA